MHGLRFGTGLILSLTLLAGPGAVAASASAVMFSAAAPAADDQEYTIGVVTADRVYVRSGAADSYYPFGQVNKGDLVKVIGDRFNWKRIATVGPAFPEDEFFGYIIYPRAQPGRFRLSEDGTIGTTLGREDVIAPNLNADFDPNSSWKPLIRLEAGVEVKVLRTTETRNNLVHHVVLPQNAEGWINRAYIRDATDEEAAAWYRAMAEAEEVAEAEPEAVEEPEPEPERVAETDEPETEAEPERLAERSEAEAEDDEPVTVLGRDQPAEPQVREEPETETVEEEPAREEATEQPEREAAEVEEAETPDPAPAEPQPVEEVEVAEEPAEPEADEPEETVGEQLARATLEDLEEAYERLREEPVETAEVEPLLRMYQDLAARSEADGDTNTKRVAEWRIEQLRIWLDVQQRRAELERIRARARVAADRTEAARLAVDEAGDYTAVGRLSASTIYDGRRLPKLLRLQDPGTGRTVAYLEPDEEGFDMGGMIGQLIGVVGEKRYDGGLRLNLISARRIDILRAEQRADERRPR